MITDKNTIDVIDLPEYLWRTRNSADPKNESKETVYTLEELQRRYVHEIVERSRNKAQAARVLGISRTTLYHLLGPNGEEKVVKSLSHLLNKKNNSTP
jgi:transcriptional regulator with PAS, ATPase and Fis domain